MDVLAIVLRIIHILSGVLWVGGATLFFLYIEPTINKLGPDAERFVDEVVNRRKLPIYFVTLSTFSVLGGAVLYWRDSSGLDFTWITSATGLAFTVGGIVALAAWLGGNLLIPKTLGQLMAVGAQMKASDGPPGPELVGRLHAVQEKLHTIGMVDTVLLGVAVVAMASARYLG